MVASPILIVDDEPSNLAILKQILAPDYSLVFANNGQQGIMAALKHRPSLILLDVQMPDLDGLTVCKILKANPETENIPVIFVSSLSEVGHEAAGFASGCVDYIIKPVSPELVKARVRTHLSLVRTTMLEKYIVQLEIQQKKIARLSRIQAVLSGINSAIVRLRDRTALFDEACRITVEHGEFGTAWIGLINGSGYQLNHVSSGGIELADLEMLFGELSAEAGNALSVPNQAVQTGCTVYCNDIRPVAENAFYRHAVTNGYSSIIAIPLAPMEKPIGVMVLYARDVDFFDEEELKLLNELGGDISFALNHIAQEERVSYLSYFDTLTGLPNNTLFLDRLEQIVQSAKHGHDGAFVAILNLHRFKHINDALGRHVGDYVLKIVAERLRSGLPKSFSVARLAGDNFSFAGEQAHDEEIAVLIDKIADVMEQAIVVNEIEVHIAVHLGIATYPNDGADTESLFKNAEAALKQAKSSDERQSYYSPEFNARMAEKIEMEGMLHTAMEKQQFEVFYQPKVDLSNGRIIGSEALIRWRHPERGMISPASFIPVAEETGLIVSIGEWVMKTACIQNKAWHDAGYASLSIAVNLSARQFKQADLLNSIVRVLQDSGLKAEYLQLELTESLVMDGSDQFIAKLNEFKALGISLSIDDFGTGYSSLSYLKRFPIDALKIDQSFVREIVDNDDDAAIALAVISLSHSLDLIVIAEGVETQEQLAFLLQEGCDEIQGYLFSRPVPADEFTQMLRDEKKLNIVSNTHRPEKTPRDPGR